LRIKVLGYTNQVKVYIRTYPVWCVAFGVYWTMPKHVEAK